MKNDKRMGCPYRKKCKIYDETKCFPFKNYCGLVENFLSPKEKKAYQLAHLGKLSGVIPSKKGQKNEY